MSLNALSDEDLTYIVNNPGYRATLQDILSPYIGEESAGADHAGTSYDGRGTDHTRPDPAQERERVETPEQRLTGFEGSADDTDSILQRISHVLGK